MKMKKIFALALAGAMLTAAAGCGNSSQPSASGASSSDDAAENTNGKLILATSADYPPYEFHKLVDGKDTIVGFDISLAQLIASELGKELEIHDIGFDSCLLDLNMDKADIVIAGMSPDKDREADFSNIYYDTTQCVLVRKDDADKYTNAASLAGKTIGAQLGSAQEKAAKAELPEAKLVSLQKIPDLLLNLSSGKSEAVVMEKFVAKTYLQTYDDMEIAFDLEYDTAGCAVAVKQGNTELLDKVNEIIDKALSDGTLDRFVEEASALAAGEMA